MHKITLLVLSFIGPTFVTLNERYAEVVAQIQSMMKLKGFKISDLICNLKTIDTDKSTIFSKHKAFTKITKMDDLFFWIAKYCNIYNYDLLVSLLESIECAEAKELIDDFTIELQHSVFKELNLSSQVEYSHIPNPVPRTQTLVIKYIGDKCTIKTENFIRNVICSCFHLKAWSVTFDHVQDGCIALVYRISSDVKSYLLQYETTVNDVTLLKECHIQSIIVDDEVLEIPSKVITRMLISNKVQW